MPTVSYDVNYIILNPDRLFKTVNEVNNCSKMLWRYALCGDHTGVLRLCFVHNSVREVDYCAICIVFRLLNRYYLALYYKNRHPLLS